MEFPDFFFLRHSKVQWMGWNTCFYQTTVSGSPYWHHDSSNQCLGMDELIASICSEFVREGKAHVALKMRFPLMWTDVDCLWRSGVLLHFKTCFYMETSQTFQGTSRHCAVQGIWWFLPRAIKNQEPRQYPQVSLGCILVGNFKQLFWFDSRNGGNDGIFPSA